VIYTGHTGFVKAGAMAGRLLKQRQFAGEEGGLTPVMSTTRAPTERNVFGNGKQVEPPFRSSGARIHF